MPDFFYNSSILENINFLDNKALSDGVGSVSTFINIRLIDNAIAMLKNMVTLKANLKRNKKSMILLTFF